MRKEIRQEISVGLLFDVCEARSRRGKGEMGTLDSGSIKMLELYRFVEASLPQGPHLHRHWTDKVVWKKKKATFVCSCREQRRERGEDIMVA